MSEQNQLTELLKALDAPQGAILRLNNYYRGDRELTFVAPELQSALGERFPRVAVNYIRLAINSIAERLRLTGFSGADVWPLWLANDLDQRSALVHREALLTGAGYVSVWSNPDGSPRIVVESCREVATQIDPGSRETVAAVKRWVDTVRKETHAVLYLPDRIERYRAQQAGAAASALALVETLDNPLGQVPIVAFRNADLPLDDGVSEVADLTGLVDMLSKLTADLMVASEYGARPRRYAAGIDLIEVPRFNEDGTPVLDVDGEPVIDTENPFPETDRMMVSENDQAKFGQLPGASLDGYRNAVDVILSEIAAISSLPPHYLGAFNHGNPTSADALRASEAGLTAKASAKQSAFGQSWEQVMRLAVAIRDGIDPADVNVRARWNDPATRSVSQESDAAQKLFGGGQLFSRTAILRRMGLSEDEIAENVKELFDEQQKEAYAKADPGLMEYNSQFSTTAQFRKAVNEITEEAA
ncbi:phage portal protein [Mycolicibacterium sp. XJ870]